MDESSTATTSQTPQAPQWKQDLVQALVSMVDALPDEAPTETEAVTPPTLEEFYRALIALESNTRKNVQKTNGALDAVAKGLRGLQLQIAQIEERSSSSSTDSGPILALNGQLLRMLDTLQNRPSALPLGLSRKWEAAWADVTSGTQIIQKAILQRLSELDIHSHSPTVGDRFDPVSMEAIKVSSSSQPEDTATVIAVIEPAYYQHEKLIRCARVHVER